MVPAAAHQRNIENRESGTVKMTSNEVLEEERGNGDDISLIFCVWLYTHSSLHGRIKLQCTMSVNVYSRNRWAMFEQVIHPQSNVLVDEILLNLSADIVDVIKRKSWHISPHHLTKPLETELQSRARTFVQRAFYAFSYRDASRSDAPMRLSRSAA